MAQEAINPVNPEFPPQSAEFATNHQLSTLYAQAQSLYENAQDPSSYQLFDSAKVVFNSEENEASYVYGSHAATGQYRMLSVKPEGQQLRITETASLPTETGRQVADRSMLINAAGTCYGSEESFHEVDGRGFALDGQKFNVKRATHIQVPKDHAETTQQLIDLIWTPTHTKRSLWRRILTS